MFRRRKVRSIFLQTGKFRSACPGETDLHDGGGFGKQEKTDIRSRLMRAQGFNKTCQILRIYANDSAARAVNVRD